MSALFGRDFECCDNDTHGATDCATCHGMGRNGYCAPRRCYCHHPECPAFEFDPTARTAHREATHATPH